MKFRVILILILLILPKLELFSQHLRFKNIPISGNIEFFVKQMTEAGFKLSQQKDNIVEMRGRFVNQDCIVYVVALPVTHSVWKVVVELPKEKSWNSLKKQFYFLQEQFTQKYGAPKKTLDYILYPFTDGDGNEFEALAQNKGTFLSLYKISTGSILLSITQWGNIQIQYEDATKSEENLQQQKKIVLEDI